MCPIPRKYKDKDGYFVLNQLFGENKVSFYAEMGLLGHTGIDFRTKNIFVWFRNWLDKRLIATKNERKGEIPILAAHDGYLTRTYNDDPIKGIGMNITSEEVLLDGVPCKVETTYFHLSELRVWKGDKLHTGWEKRKGENFVKAGTIIGWGGNTGKYTTGAHLHFGMRPLWKKGKSYVAQWNNGYNGRVNPLPYLKGKYKIRESILKTNYYNM